MVANCMYCEENEKLQSLMFRVGELEHSILYLMKDQKFKGRCVLAAKNHYKELFEMPEDERNGLFADCAKVTKAISEIFNPGKINLGAYGDLVHHFHLHIVPKYEGGLQWGLFVWDKDVPPVFLKPEEYEEIKAQLKEKLGLK